MSEFEKDLYFMHIALEEASLAFVEDEVPIGAVIVRGDKIIARTHNSQRQDNSSLAHAEIKAIDMACKALNTRYLSDCMMYVTLEPCPMCAGAIVMARLNRLCYGAKDVRQGCIDSVYALASDKDFYWRVPAFGGVLESECKDLLTSFFNKKRSGNKL